MTYRLSDFELVIQALTEGRLKPESMITRKISINRVVEDGFKGLDFAESVNLESLAAIAV